MSVFVDRELTARRGRKRAQLRIRIHAPRPDARGEPNWECALEVTVDGKRLTGTPPNVFGYDGMQALLLAIGMTVLLLERFENDTGMRVEPWQWHDLWALRPHVAMVGTHDRAAAMRALDRKRAAAAKHFTRSSSRTAARPRAPAPRAKPAARKAPRRRRASPRAS